MTTEVFRADIAGTACHAHGQREIGILKNVHFAIRCTFSKIGPVGTILGGMSAGPFPSRAL